MLLPKCRPSVIFYLTSDVIDKGLPDQLRFAFYTGIIQNRIEIL